MGRKTIHCSKLWVRTVEKRKCLTEIVAGNKRIKIRVLLLLKQSANQFQFNQRMDTKRDGLLVYHLKLDVV